MLSYKECHRGPLFGMHAPIGVQVVLFPAFGLCGHRAIFRVDASLPRSLTELLPRCLCIACTGRHSRPTPPPPPPPPHLHVTPGAVTSSGRGDHSIDPTRHQEVQAPSDGESLLQYRSLVHPEMLMFFDVFIFSLLSALFFAKKFRLSHAIGRVLLQDTYFYIHAKCSI